MDAAIQESTRGGTGSNTKYCDSAWYMRTETKKERKFFQQAYNHGLSCIAMHGLPSNIAKEVNIRISV